MELFEINFLIMSIFGIAIFVTMFVLIFSQIKKQKNQPKLMVYATVIGKREDHRRIDHNRHTYYYVTFKVEGGDRIELVVNGSEYGLLFEGDSGKLTFQGNVFIDFQTE